MKLAERPAAARAAEPAEQPLSQRWHSVELRQLSALAAVAEHRSFRLAAESLGYVQSAVSHQIVQLERLAGARLIERSRGPGSAALTPAGELLLTHAEAVFAELREARESFSAHAVAARGKLRLGMTESVAAVLAPKLSAHMAARGPGTELTLQERAADADLLTMLANAQLDVVLAELAHDDEGVETEPLMLDPYVLVVPEDHAARFADPDWALAQLADEPLISYVCGRGTPLIETRLTAAGVTPDVRMRSASTATIAALVAGGLGYAVVPRLALDPRVRGIVAIEVGDRFTARTLGLIWDPKREHLALDQLRMAARLVADRVRRSALP